MKRIGQCIQTVRVTGTVRQPAQQQTEYAQLFVKRRVRSSEARTGSQVPESSSSTR